MWECPACPEDREWCDHEAEWMPLARALATHFGQGDSMTSAWWGSFLDDAGVLFDDAGPGPRYQIVGLENGSRSVHAFVLDGRLIVTVEADGKDGGGEPLIAARIPDGLYLSEAQAPTPARLCHCPPTPGLDLDPAIGHEGPCW